MQNAEAVILTGVILITVPPAVATGMNDRVSSGSSGTSAECQGCNGDDGRWHNSTMIIVGQVLMPYLCDESRQSATSHKDAESDIASSRMKLQCHRLECIPPRWRITNQD